MSESGHEAKAEAEADGPDAGIIKPAIPKTRSMTETTMIFTIDLAP